MSEVFFIGDTHFGHKNIITFDSTKAFRPFATIEEHDVELIRRWNARVRPKDIVWHLGDFCFGKDKLWIAGHLNGDKRLIMGNHDHYASADYLQHFTKLLGAVEYKGMILTHIPVHPDQFNRFTHNIHGHLHTHKLPDNRYICVSAEQVNLTPITLPEIRDRLTQSSPPR